MPPEKSDSQPLELQVVSAPDPQRILEAMMDKPELASQLAKEVTRVVVACDPRLAVPAAVEHRRLIGSLTAAVMGTTFVLLGGVLAVMSSSMAVASLLITLGAACAGSSFALFSGKTVSTEDFGKLLKAVSSALKRN